MEAASPTDRYRTLRAPVREETVVQGSRFIADALPATSVDDAMAKLAKIRGEFHAATHHCWAYRIGAERHEERYADDGEPAGTAGKPIAQAIERRELTNVIVVVTRYFGGVKLGTGGLARAYADAAARALDAATIVEETITRTLRISCSFEVLPRVKSLIYRATSSVREEYTPDPVIRATLPRSAVEALQAALVEVTRGNAQVVVENSGDH